VLEIKNEGGIKVKILSLILLINTALAGGTIIVLRANNKKIERKLDDIILVQNQVSNKLSCFEDNALDSLWDIKHDLENKDKQTVELNEKVIKSIKTEADTLYFKLLFPPLKTYRRNS